MFRLPAEFGVLFWRARATPAQLRIQLEVPPRYRHAAARALAAGVAAAFGVEAAIEALPPGTLVPARLLTAPPEIMKPRGLFTEDEDWDRALRYF